MFGNNKNNLFDQEDFRRMRQEEEQRNVSRRIKENHANGVACCPKCGSTSLSANQKGFGIGKAVVGAAAFGAIGLAAGNIHKHKLRVTCLNCGHSWKLK